MNILTFFSRPYDSDTLFLYYSTLFEIMGPKIAHINNIYFTHAVNKCMKHYFLLKYSCTFGFSNNNLIIQDLRKYNVNIFDIYKGRIFFEFVLSH